MSETIKKETENKIADLEKINEKLQSNLLAAQNEIEKLKIQLSIYYNFYEGFKLGQDLGFIKSQQNKDE